MPVRINQNMNYEEMIETRDIRENNKIWLPYGYFHKRLINGKYTNFVEFHDELVDFVFSSCVRAECQDNATIANKCQLHFTPNEGDGEVYAIAIEVGNFVTFEQLLNDMPAVVAQKDFISETIENLVELTCELNERGIYHLCFAPQNVFVKKNSNSVRLLCHGSYYQRLDQEALYERVEEYVAPEVLSGGEVDGRADVYSLAKFVEYLYRSSGLPLELRPVIKKATSEEAEKRYASVREFAAAMKNYRNMWRTGIAAAAALAVSLALVGLFFYVLPSPDPVEFVEKVEDPVTEDMLEDLDALLGIGADADSATIAQFAQQQQYIRDSLKVDDKKMREYEAKAEEIFRKQFTKEADAILSRVYNPERMNGGEKEFVARSQAMTEELARKQAELTEATYLPSDRTQRIASEIIDQLTEQKKAALDKDYMGFKKKPQEEEETTTTKDKK